MPTHAASRGRFRLSARILIIGLWTVLFGMFILFFTVQLFATLSAVPGGGLLGSEGLGVGGMLADSLLMLYRGGFFTLGAGGVLMAFGSMFVIGVAR